MSVVDRLLADLRGHDAIRRGAAVARLRVIGSRAVVPLANLADSTAPAAARAAALEALDGATDPRAADVALSALKASDVEVVLAALAVLRGWVAREPGTRVLEALTVVALDKGRDASLRLAALDALSELPRHLVEPILERAPRDEDSSTFDDPQAALAWLAAHEADAPFSVIHNVVTVSRERERTQAPARHRQEWLSARGAAHAALARRGSRVAVYDLREAFEAARTPLPLDFLTAITTVGDASCLEPMARAWAASTGEPWWRERLAEAARDIVRRLELTGRNAVIKRVRTKWKDRKSVV